MARLVRILNYLRLAAFPLGYGLTGALVGGTLNRIMIADLGLPAFMVGVFFAVPLLVSPARLWLGYRSDGFPILGKRREPYLILGSAVTGIGVVAAVLATINLLGTSTNLFIAVLATFIVYGLGRNLAHNTFQALLADTFKGDQRPRAVTGYEVATLLGLVVGAGGLGSALETFEPDRLVAVTAGAVIVAFLLTVFASIRQEKGSAQVAPDVEKARAAPFGKAVREVVLGDPQVRLFFTIVVFTFVGTLAQDVLLEPYGALVLGMSVGDTTRLTAFWGLGVMASMLLSGAFLIKWLGHMRVLRIGLISSMLVFLGVILSGFMGQIGLFRALVVVMGLGTGLAGAGMLTGVINFTTSIRAGLLMGVWGMANLIGRAFGSLMGGGLVDLVQRIGGEAFLAYASVFALEAVMLLVAWILSYRLNIEASRASVEVQLKGQLAPAD